MNQELAVLVWRAAVLQSLASSTIKHTPCNFQLWMEQNSRKEF